MSTENTSVIKYKSGKNRYEIVITRGTHKDFKDGKLPISKIVETEIIFTNAEKGTRASQEELKAAFPDMTTTQILEKIAREGELILSTEERRQATEMKKRQIVEYISKTYIDPKTKTPHPVTRITNAMNTIKGLQIDINRSVQDQVNDVVKKISTLIPLHKNETSGHLTISMVYYAKALGIIKKWCHIRKEKMSNNNFILEISFATTDMNDFMNQLTQVTNGDYQFDNDEQLSVPTAEESTKSNDKKSKKSKKSKK